MSPSLSTDGHALQVDRVRQSLFWMPSQPTSFASGRTADDVRVVRQSTSVSRASSHVGDAEHVRRSAEPSQSLSLTVAADLGGCPGFVISGFEVIAVDRRSRSDVIAVHDRARRPVDGAVAVVVDARRSRSRWRPGWRSADSVSLQSTSHSAKLVAVRRRESFVGAGSRRSRCRCRSQPISSAPGVGRSARCRRSRPPGPRGRRDCRETRNRRRRCRRTRALAVLSRRPGGSLIVGITR